MTYTLRPDLEVAAVRVTLGVTTAEDILGVCPDANIGQVVGGPLTDLRWIVLPDGTEVRDGEWIVRFSPVPMPVHMALWVVLDDHEFRALIEEKP
ncbi:hypothetical protein SEA_VANLEE_70 [Gordonia phage VanLee]|uniref:Uncharacterized protein n=1 Tax=Gordonia phage VanLee TaxID=2845816 RepID=A0A8F2IFH7_9CAUD|nr:hypothetical protein QEH49_gp070 [Gordonia phage VanLee]QWS68187.1 hypothetical protein SEA_VANLEE_70 [Gordonia phage VanLee]